jgi:hypothetical protein
LNAGHAAAGKRSSHFGAALGTVVRFIIAVSTRRLIRFGHLV